MIALAASEAGACEDDHPPVTKTPAESFRLSSASRNDVLSLTFDPRGVGAVIPNGDDSNFWIDTADKTGAWHYREWQWWKGHPWGDSCRPRFYAQQRLHASREAPGRVEIAYRIDGFDCRQTFLMPDSIDDDEVHWDLVTTIRNNSGRDVEEYGQFFACYTPPNRGRSFWYWDESNKLVLFSDRGVTHLDGYVANPDAYFLSQGAIPHCPRGGGKIVGRWHRPIMVSQASPAGWRSIIMLNSRHAASLAQGIEGGAMDYIVFPGPDQSKFAHDTEFSAHIRHVVLKSPDLPSPRQLEEIWNDFERSHVTARDRAAQPVRAR